VDSKAVRRKVREHSTFLPEHAANALASVINIGAY
jgi:hypothetical protein